MSLELLLLALVPSTYLVMLVIEARFPARRFPPIKAWRAAGILGLVLMMAVSVALPLVLPVEWLAAHRLIDATSLGVPLGVVVGYLVLSFASFVWHYCLHRFDVLWRLFHQVHHAPKRSDLSAAVAFHPFDLVGFGVIQTLALTLVIGVDPVAAGITGFVAAFYSLFQHWNVKTPRWLGYVIQRPEAHCVHHQVGVHAGNYSDFPLWDLAFGTFVNPARFEGAVGFDVPAPLSKMLLCEDVHRAHDALD